MTIGNGEYKPLDYSDKGCTIVEKENLSKEAIGRLSEGEIITVVNIEGQPLSVLIVDSFGLLREGPIRG